ncbi:MAG: allophanate hydrolase subunit 1 [Fimbriimonadales bacterium]|nr:allophanate hydrolase subunit 1 [Fimbriimonadales bacterium]
MRLVRLSERLWVVRDIDPWDPPALAEAVRQAGWPDLEEATEGLESVGLYFREPFGNAGSLERRLLELRPVERAPGAAWRIPVCYELGLDLDSAAADLGLSVDGLVELHARRPYRCLAVGFSPGFPYLGPLPSELTGLPRLPAPRPKVPAGAVGIVGGHTCVYPSETPGGWRIVGVTPLRIASLEEERFPIRPGDSVEFEPIGRAEFQRLEGRRLWEAWT